MVGRGHFLSGHWSDYPQYRLGRQGSLPVWPLVGLSLVPAWSAGVTSCLATGQTIPSTGWVGRGHFLSGRCSDYPQYRLGLRAILCRRRVAVPFRIVVILFRILLHSHRHLHIQVLCTIQIVHCTIVSIVSEVAKCGLICK
jgi:hypothetical protein